MIVPKMPSAESMDSMALSQKEILQKLVDNRMAELREIGKNINHYKELGDDAGVKREEAIYQQTQNKMYQLLGGIQQLTNG